MIFTRTSTKKKNPTFSKGDRFSVRTRIARAVGKNSRFATDTVRVIPAPTTDSNRNDNTGGVILQATDGHQAVCVMASGKVNTSVLIPPEVLPTRRMANDIQVHRENGHWLSSEGRVAQARTDGSFPPIGEVLPQLGKHPFTESAKHVEQRRKVADAVEHEYVVLGVDTDILRKSAEALGTSKLTLFVPVPVCNETTKSSETFVNKPIALCPATSQGRVPGIGAIMPLKPEHGINHYEQLRRDVVEAERQIEQPKPKAAAGKEHRKSR